MAMHNKLILFTMFGIMFFGLGCAPTPVHEPATPAHESPTPVHERPTPVYEPPKPVFRIKRIPVPPENKEGQACVTKCIKKIKACRNECQQAYKQCDQDAPEAARLIYEKAYDRYLKNLKVYNEEMKAWDYYTKEHERLIKERENQLNYNRRHCRDPFYDRIYCERASVINDELKERYSRYDTLLKMKPKYPAKPSEEILIQKEREKCNNESKKCGCEDKFESCFIDCGGKFETKRICIENCD
jgi:hypothetical protein